MTECVRIHLLLRRVLLLESRVVAEFGLQDQIVDCVFVLLHVHVRYRSRAVLVHFV